MLKKILIGLLAAKTFIFAADINVAAAADLKFALAEIAKAYETTNKDAKVKVTFGASGKLTTEGNKEILFARPDCNINEINRHATPRGCAGNGGYGITQSLVDAFFMENGLPPIVGYNTDGSPIINEASGYKEKGFSTAPEIRNTKWIESQGDGKVTLAGTYNMYTHREPRFYISVLYNRAWYRSENRTTRFMIGEWDGGPTHDAPQNGYLLRKTIHPDHEVRNGVFPYYPGILLS